MQKVKSNKITCREFLDIRHKGDQKSIQRAEEQFFNQIWLANGTAKTTASGRLYDFDSLIIGEVEGRAEVVKVLDIGISSGVTTAEMHERLKKDQVNHIITGIDLAMGGTIFSLKNAFEVLVSSLGQPLQFDIFGRVFTLFPGETVLAKMVRVPALSFLKGFYKLLMPWMDEVGYIPLTCDAVRNTPAIHTIEMSFFDIGSLGEIYDVIRCANILNRRYFDDHLLTSALVIFEEVLRPGGLLCIVRTDDTGKNNGTVFQKKQDGLQEIKILGAGSEITKLVLNLDNVVKS